MKRHVPGPLSWEERGRTTLSCWFGLLLMAVITQVAGAETSVKHLRCEYLTNPLGIDVPQPRLSWRIESGRRGERQKAYQVLVASTAEILAADQSDLWDSGKVESDQSIQVGYAGKPLSSRQCCYWKVRNR